MADLNIPPPPPYSETDIYSNPSSRTPRAPGAYPSSPSRTDTASIASSIIYTPPYTPAEEHEDQFISPSQFYFDSRPITYRAIGPTFGHEITITAHANFENFPYEASFADRDITTQDWATFVNFLLPQHIDNRNGEVASEKMKAELLDERMRQLTIDGEKAGLDMSNVDAQLGQLAPRMEAGEGQVDVNGVVLEWNRRFFEPRGVRIIAHMDVEDPPIVLPDEISEFRRNQFGPPEAQPPGSSLPSRTGFLGERTRSGGDVHAAGRNDDLHRRHGRPRNWGWSDHGPGQQNNREAGGRDGRLCNGGYRMGIPDNNDGCAGCRRCGPRRARADENTPQSRTTRNAEFDVPQGEHFKLGPMVADERGFRIGTLFVADNEGVKIGPMFVGKSPPEPRDGSDEESADSTVSAESEGSLPDLDDVTPRQLPVLKQSLMDWLNHPEQPVSKVQMKQMKANLRLTQADKTTFKPEGEELVRLKTELKEMKRRFRAAKRERRNISTQLKRERRQKKREERRARRHERLEGKLAARREARGKFKATNCSKQAAREAEMAVREAAAVSREAQAQSQQAQQQARAHSQQIQQQVRQTVNGFLGFTPPPMGAFDPCNNPRGRFRPFGRGRGSAWAQMAGQQPPQPPVPRSPVPPTMPCLVPPVPGIPAMPTMPSMPPRQASTTSFHSAHSAHSVQSDHQENVTYLRAEATRHRSDAAALRASAESMRHETQNTSFDEKARVKLSYDAAELEEEARRLEEEGDRCLAEAMQLEGDQEGERRREEERNRDGGRDYMRRMREGAGVIV